MASKKGRVPLALDRSIDQMLGRAPRRVDEEERGLPARWERAMSTPVGELDEMQLGTLLTQSPSEDELALLIPVAVELLARDPYAAWVCVPRIVEHRRIVDASPELYARAVAVMAASVEQLSDEEQRAVLDFCGPDTVAMLKMYRAAQAIEDEEGRVELVREIVKRRVARAGVGELARGAELVAEARELLFDVLAEDAEEEVAVRELEGLCAEPAAWRRLTAVLVERAGKREERGDREAALEDLVRAADVAATRVGDERWVAVLAERIGALRRRT
jgi:hypothetical protein